MPSQWMTFRKRRIVEILGGIAAHPEPFHDGARAVVGRGCERHDVRERESAKPVAERQQRRSWLRDPISDNMQMSDKHGAATAGDVIFLKSDGTDR
jgi:hypothetical protein